MKKSVFFSYCLVAVFLLPGPGWAADTWRQAESPRVWSFPLDHGAHPEYRTEWWYFTGNVSDAAGSDFGYQLTFFRQGIRQKLPDPAGPWDIRDVYLGHFAITDAGGKKFQYGERMSRPGPGLAGAETTGLNVWLLDWSARMEGRAILLRARHDRMEMDLTLTPRKAPVLHGQKGLSRKGPGAGQASYYTSVTDLATEGFLKSAVHDRTAVRGQSWFDHEFGSNQLAKEQTGWDWFGLSLSDGRDLMIYLLRRRDGSIEPASQGTLVEATGESRRLPLSAILVTVLDEWNSPQSGGRYPARWRIRIPAAAIDVTLAPTLADQELVTKGSTGVTYWEGAVSGQGTSRDRPVRCKGYVELTGYSGSLGSLF